MSAMVQCDLLSSEMPPPKNKEQHTLLETWKMMHVTFWHRNDYFLKSIRKLCGTKELPTSQCRLHNLLKMSKENTLPRQNNQGRSQIVSSRMIEKVMIQKARKNPGLAVGKRIIEFN